MLFLIAGLTIVCILINDKKNQITIGDNITYHVHSSQPINFRATKIIVRNILIENKNLSIIPDIVTNSDMLPPIF